jgi:hypothetical protein
VIILFEHVSIKIDGSKYILNIFNAKPADPTCDFQKTSCPYVVDDEAVDEDCEAKVSFDNAKIAGKTLTAGGPAYKFPFDLPLLGGVKMKVSLSYARLQADVTLSGGKVKTMSGILAGAVPKAAIMAAIESTPDEELPLPKQTILDLIDVVAEADIDADGDGKKDSCSIGLKFTAFEGSISGTQ